MARYYRRYRRYRRYRPRLFFLRFRRRGGRRFVNGSSKSQCRVKVPMQYRFNITVAASNAGGVYGTPFTPFANSSGAHDALTSPLYQAYANLYEEVKCIGMKLILTIGTPIGTSTVPNLTVVTAWDRRLTNNDLVNPPSWADLQNYSTQQRAVAVNNSIGKLKRSIYASDLIEKAQYHDCSMDPGPPAIDTAYQAAGANTNFFSPGMWLGVSQGGAAAQTISFEADVTYYFAFRNPKYGGMASNKGGFMSTTDPIDFGDMDDQGGDVDLPDGDIDDSIVLDGTTRGGSSAAAPVTSTNRGVTVQANTLVGELRRQMRANADLERRRPKN